MPNYAERLAPTQAVGLLSPDAFGPAAGNSLPARPSAGAIEPTTK